MKQAAQGSGAGPALLGTSRAMLELRTRIQRLASHDSDVLIQGVVVGVIRKF